MSIRRELNRGCLLMEIILSLHVIILVGSLILLAFMWAGWIHFD